MAKGKYEYWLTQEGLLELEGWARDGLTDEQIAYNMGINKATLYRWKEKYCDICDSLKRGKEVVDRQVENSLFERALGGTHEVRKTFKVKEKYYDDHGKLCEKRNLCKQRMRCIYREIQQHRFSGLRTGNLRNGGINGKLRIIVQLIN